jgi:PAS domain S-box-containing protein
MASTTMGSAGIGQLGDTQRRLDAVLNNASVSIILMDDRQQCVYMNRAAEHLTGFTLDEVLALDRPLHDIVHHTRPDGSPFPLAECAIDRAFPEHNQTQGEETFVHKDGSFYPVAFTASPIRDEESKTIGTIIEVRDIREEKAARERQRFLIDELNHRVKNTLAAVQSIAYQSLKGADADARQALEGRLVALSGAHNVLTEQGWAGASLCTAIETAIAPFRAPGRFELVGADHPLAPKMVVSLSMVIHELATNAVKYGALSVPDGVVQIEWNVSRGADGERLAMRWEEVGGPPVAMPTRKGFGTRLLERQVSLEFNGSITLQYRPAGLLCQMDLGLPGADGADPVMPGMTLGAVS